MLYRVVFDNHIPELAPEMELTYTKILRHDQYLLVDRRRGNLIFYCL